MTQAIRITADNDNELSTILSERVLIPVTCDHCEKDTDVSLETLKSTSTVTVSYTHLTLPTSDLV